MVMYEFAEAAITKYHTLCDSNNRNALAVLEAVCSRSWDWPGVFARDLSHGLPCPHVIIPLCLNLLSHKDTNRIGSELTHTTAFYLDYLFKGLIAKCSHILRFWRLELQLGFGEDTIPPVGHDMCPLIVIEVCLC